MKTSLWFADMVMLATGGSVERSRQSANYIWYTVSSIAFVFILVLLYTDVTAVARNKPTDIALLAQAFTDGTSLTPHAQDVLTCYALPGNVSEWRCVVGRAVALADGGLIDEQHLPDTLHRPSVCTAPITLPPEGLSPEAVEVALLEQALSLAGGNKTRAAELLGLSRHTLLYGLEKYGLGS